LGRRYIIAVDNRLAALSENPEIFSIKSSGYNEVVVEKFPYLIVYKIMKKHKKIRVLHAFHTSRNPNLKK
jgi:plasmid stabilization system protein ParE